LLIPGGTYYRSYNGVDFTDKSYPATVGDFYLDKYEVTVDRFRQFVNAGMGTQANPPAAAAGAHPLIASSGWDSTWNTKLPADTASLKAAMICDSVYYPGSETWTDTAGTNESLPMNCLDWYTAFAFCAWDGGRLPTEAEWDYAASGGSEQRYYPWSSPPTSTTIDDSYAVYCGDSCDGPQNVGSRSPKGDGKWGQSDLAGNLGEWTLDADLGPTYPTPCDNCAALITDNSMQQVRSGNFRFTAPALRSAWRAREGIFRRFLTEYAEIPDRGSCSGDTPRTCEIRWNRQASGYTEPRRSRPRSRNRCFHGAI
jgi:formylglycine-generating enzyme required for sulfatase activity